jgi:hypothetical protein
MAVVFPVVWSLYGRTQSGSLELTEGRLVLRGRTQAYSVPVALIGRAAIERGPASRLRGLPSLVVRLAQGDVLTIASLGGTGSLQELFANIVRERERVAKGSLVAHGSPA